MEGSVVGQLVDYFGSGSTVTSDISRRRKYMNATVVFIGSFGLWLCKVYYMSFGV